MAWRRAAAGAALVVLGGLVGVLGPWVAAPLLGVRSGAGGVVAVLVLFELLMAGVLWSAVVRVRRAVVGPYCHGCGWEVRCPRCED